MKKVSILIATVLFSATGFASSQNIRGFLNKTQGSWNGDGTMMIRQSTAATYIINVTQTGDSVGVDEWTVSTQTEGMPGKPVSSTAQYKLLGEQLTVTTGQFSVVAEVNIAEPNHLKFSTSHTDPVSGKTVTAVKDMSFTAAGLLSVVSDVNQGATVVQHFDYVLQRDSQN